MNEVQSAVGPLQPDTHDLMYVCAGQLRLESDQQGLLSRVTALEAVLHLAHTTATDSLVVDRKAAVEKVKGRRISKTLSPDTVSAISPISHI